MVIVAEVNAFVQLVMAATKLAAQLQDGWWKGSAELEKFQQQVLMLRNKHDQWSAQVHRHGLSYDTRLLLAAEAALQILEKQQRYVTSFQNSCLPRLKKKAFPGLLSSTLENVLATVEAGPQLVAESIAHYDLLERRRAQTPAPLPFVHDPKYVPISESIDEIRKALETPEGPRVVTVYGGPGLGKTSAVKYVALQYAEERKSMSTPTFPDGVYYLFCGQRDQQRVDQLQLELVECLGFGASASAPTDLTAGGAQQGLYFQQPSTQLKLRSCLSEQKLLIILDNLWEGEVLQQLLVPAKGVKYLITSQMKQIWRAAKKIRLQNPTQCEARDIMANYIDGLPTRGEFPEDIQDMTSSIVRKLEYHPLSLANVGISINERRINDCHHWKAIRDNIHGFLDNVNDFQDNPDLYDQRYSLPVGASMMLMVESLPQEARTLLFLLALLDGKQVPEALLKFFYRVLRGVAKPGFLLQYDNQEKYLEDRSLVTLIDLHGDDKISKSVLAAHKLRTHYIRQNKAPDLQSLALQMVPSCTDQDVERIQNGDAEETLLAVMSALYYEQTFRKVVVPTLQNHLRIISNESVTIPRSINSQIETFAVDQLRYQRSHFAISFDPIDDLVQLLDVDRGETGWKEQARECAKKIIIKLACQGQLDDASMTSLVELPQTTSIAFAALGKVVSFLIFRRITDDDEINTLSIPYGNNTFSIAYPITMKALLTLVYDDATSTRRRLDAIRTLVCIQTWFEDEDTLLKVGRRFTELLAMDSNPAVQVAIAQAVGVWCEETVMQTDMWEVLIGLLVSAKDYKLRTAAGRTLSALVERKNLAQKIVSIPNALAKLFDLFLSKPRKRRRAMAGKILATLASVPENRSKFRGLKGSVEGLGDILSTLEVTRRAASKAEDLDKLEDRACEAAGILSALALDEELKETIALLPGLEGGLLFLQIVQMAPVFRNGTCQAMSSTKALAILFSNSDRRIQSCIPSTVLFSNPDNRTQSCIPFIRRLKAFTSRRGLPVKKCFMGSAYASVHWTLLVLNLETGAYREALENSALAQNHLRSSESSQLKIGTYNYFKLYTPIFKQIGLYLRAMLNDYAGALSAANSLMTDEFCHRPTLLIERGIVKRLTGDFGGALDDFNLAWKDTSWRNDLLRNRGYVKHLMGDDTGARQDAEAAQRRREPESTIKSIERLWQLQSQPINYLGYCL